MHRLFDPLIEKSSNLGAGLDWKTSLQELTATEGLGVPEYLVTETGPDHEKTFTAAARVGGVSYGTGTGRSKKEAEQQAAESAWRAIRAAADERGQGEPRPPRTAERRRARRPGDSAAEAAPRGPPTPRPAPTPDGRLPSRRPPASLARGGRPAGPARERPSTPPPGRDPQPAPHVRRRSTVPELPEVEVVRRGLERWVAGRTDRRGRGPAPARRAPPPGGRATDFAPGCKGHRVGVPAAPRQVPVAAAGGHGRTSVLAHLGMSGQLLVQPHDAADEKHLRIRVRFDDGRGTELRFVDQRTFGGLSLHDTTPDGLPDVIAHIARDPLDPLFDDDGLPPALRRRRTTIKRALLDQSLISGVGNIYADEALWRARLHYERPTATLHPPPHRRTARPRPGRDERGPRRRRHQLRQPLRQRERRVRLLRPLAGRLRPRGRALPPLRHPDAPPPLDEPLQLLLPELPARAAEQASVDGADGTGGRPRRPPVERAGRAPCSPTLAGRKGVRPPGDSDVDGQRRTELSATVPAAVGCGS